MNKTTIFILIFIFLSFCGAAQKKDSEIGSEVVNVIGTYTPTISDAFKVKETPSFDDETITNKEKIEYSIVSFPVASTFTPSKTSAQEVEKQEKEKYFDNYTSIGIGNYGTFLGELYLTHNIETNQYIGAMLKHRSSQGGIKDAVLDDFFYDTSLDLTYLTQEEHYNWSAAMGYKNQVYNWYGLPVKHVNFLDTTILSVNEKQTYNSFYIGGKIAVNQSVFDQSQVYYQRFWDAQKSTENRFWIKPSFNVEFAQTQIKIDVIADYIGTEYQKDYFWVSSLEYSHFNLGVQPSFIYQQDELSVKIGAGLFYNIGKRNSKSDNKIRVYPQIQGSYRVVGDLMIAYAGVEGTLQQNSYADFVTENPFVSPDQTLIPTDKKYDFYVGLKGKLADNIAYNLRGSYKNERAKPFYSSLYESSNSNTEGYAFGNSFYVLYDNLKTLDFFGEIKTEITKDISVFANANYRNYSTFSEAEAWYMPSIRFLLGTNINITEQFSISANVFYVGERKAKFDLDVLSIGTSTSITETLDGYVDVNVGMNYKFNSRFGLFLDFYNLTDESYEKWFNFPVQGIQILGGANYKFDF